MIIGLYLITPFLRTFVNKKHIDLILFFLVISILTQFSKPIFNTLSWNAVVECIDQFNLGFFGGYITYYILGWYVDNIEIKKKGFLYFLGLVSLCITIGYVQKTGDYGYAYSNTSPFTLLYALALFTLFNRGIRWNLNHSLKKIIVGLSQLSFGVYITHPLLLYYYKSYLPYTKAPLQYILTCFVLIIVISFVSCFILSKLPLIKKLIKA